MTDRLAGAKDYAKKGAAKHVMQRGYNWNFVLYIMQDDNTPKEHTYEDIKSELRALNVPCACILHDLDKNDDGTPKRSHVHVLLHFNTQTSRRQVIEMLDESFLGDYCNHYIEHTRDYIAMNRYLIHLDDEDKTLYHSNRVHTYGGYVWETNDNKGREAKEAALASIIDAIFDYDFTEFYQVVRYARENHPNWMHFICKDYTFAIKSLCDSNRYARSYQPTCYEYDTEEAQSALNEHFGRAGSPAGSPETVNYCPVFVNELD